MNTDVAVPPPMRLPAGGIIDESGGFGFANGPGLTERSPCEKFSQSLVDQLYNVVKHGGFDDPKDSAAQLGQVWEDRALKNRDENGNLYRKNDYPIGGFKPDLVSNNQDAEVYRHVLFTAGNALEGNDLENWAFTQYHKLRSLEDNPRGKEAETEIRDDYAGRAVGQAMVKTVQAGKSGDYGALYNNIKNTLCD